MSTQTYTKKAAFCNFQIINDEHLISACRFYGHTPLESIIR